MGSAEERLFKMPIAPHIIGMIISGSIILFNEPIALWSTRVYHKVFGITFDDAALKRSKLMFIMSGTILMIMNAMSLHAALVSPT
jgi:hypothetical protein